MIEEISEEMNEGKSEEMSEGMKNEVKEEMIITSDAIIVKVDGVNVITRMNTRGKVEVKEL